MEQEETTIYYKLFDKWCEDLEKHGEEVRTLRAVFCNTYGCTEISPLALMYTAFIGGLEEGKNLALRIADIERGKDENNINS